MSVLPGGGDAKILIGNDSSSPVPVSIEGADVTINAEIGSSVEISNDVGNPVPVNGTVSVLQGFQIPAYDEFELDPPLQPTTITYKLGGETVATVTLTYDGTNVESGAITLPE